MPEVSQSVQPCLLTPTRGGMTRRRTIVAIAAMLIGATAAAPGAFTGAADQRSLGVRPTENDPSGETIYVGTDEANICASGCVAGTGIYKSTDGGATWTSLGNGQFS